MAYRERSGMVSPGLVADEALEAIVLMEIILFPHGIDHMCKF